MVHRSSNKRAWYNKNARVQDFVLRHELHLPPFTVGWSHCTVIEVSVDDDSLTAAGAPGCTLEGISNSGSERVP